MATPAMTPLANITLGSNQTSVTFSNISQNYRDLVLIYNGTLVTAGSLVLQFNNDTAANYFALDMTGNGTTTVSGYINYVGGVLFGRTYAQNANQQIVATANIMDYSTTDKHKTVLSRGNAAQQMVEADAFRWASTAPISSVTVLNNGGNFAAGSTFSLYGVIA